MQVYTLLQIDNHASMSPLTFFYRPNALLVLQLPNQQHHSTKVIMNKECLETYPVISMVLLQSFVADAFNHLYHANITPI